MTGPMQYPGNGNHPHSRGVNSTGVWQNSDPVGSSPLAWGLPNSLHGFVLGGGIIPAHAGLTRPQGVLVGPVVAPVPTVGSALTLPQFCHTLLGWETRYRAD